MRVGVVVNPVAGMGGRVGLKGTDGKVDEARERGAEPRAPGRAVEALESLAQRAPDATVLTGPGRMGAEEARETGLDPIVVGDVDPERTYEPTSTTAEDTRAVVRAFLAFDPDPEEGRDHPGDGRTDDTGDGWTDEPGVDLVLFVGGDGTAVDVAETLDDAGVDTPMLGVPAGVKVYSSVFAVTPREAGRIAAEFDRVTEREVNDIDEDAYRGGEVHTELRAVRPVPVADGLQSSKQLGGGSVEGLVEGVLADVEPGTTYVFGPGSTVGAIEDALGIDGSPLGVDVWRAAPAEEWDDDRPSGELLARDATEDEILAAIDDPSGASSGEHSSSGVSEDVVVVVSPIGGQGFVFGRGNHQISPAVLREADVEIVGSRSKLDDLGVLRVDTDDPELDDELRGWTKVRVGRVERRMMQIA